MMMTTYLGPEDLEQRYAGKISTRTLANWRAIGIGPRFAKIGGRILYRLDDLVAWENSRLSNSTKHYGAASRP